MKHTKGTWYTSESINIHEQRIIADEETGQTIAVCYGRGGHDIRESETEANAHLIASAPELLEAAKLIVSRVESDKKFLFGEGQHGLAVSFIAETKKAITKAEGK